MRCKLAIYCIETDTSAQYHTTQKNTMKAHLLQMKKIPEDPRHLKDILDHIQSRNSQTKWPSNFQPVAVNCQLCRHLLSEPLRVPGSDGKSYLLTRIGLLPVTALMKRCTNSSCTARYNYCKWDKGIHSY